MNQQLKQWLITSGLDEQRAELYLAVLSKGEATASELADTIQVGRTAVYDNLRVLEEKGYVYTVHQGKRKVFIPLHPKELYKKFEQQRQQLKDLLPDFLAVYAQQTSKPFVQLFTGEYAAREVFEDILNVTKKEYVYFSPQQLTYSRVEHKYMEQWITKRVKKGISCKSLRVKGQELFNEPLFTLEKEYNRQIRFLPAYVDLKSSIYIYENNVGVISTKAEGSAFIIYSPDLAFSFRSIFDFLWSISLRA